MKSRTDELFGAIEAGGTKFICAAGNGPDNLQVARFPTSTPKPNWNNTNLLGAVKSEFDIPIGFQTDTNAAAE